MHLVVLFLLCVDSAVALTVMFESFEQMSGFNLTFFDLRVRKINRTTTAINGTAFVREFIGNEIQFSMDLFHSRLGNQQFNHYPMKLPSCGTCDFIDQLHNNYEEQIKPIENLARKGECPVSPGEVFVRDYVFPIEVVPRVMPRGLWKAVITGRKDGQVVGSYAFVVKGYDDY